MKRDAPIIRRVSDPARLRINCGISRSTSSGTYATRQRTYVLTKAFTGPS
jgi:hypothetical protein